MGTRTLATDSIDFTDYEVSADHHAKADFDYASFDYADFDYADFDRADFDDDADDAEVKCLERWWDEVTNSIIGGRALTRPFLYHAYIMILSWF